MEAMFNRAGLTVGWLHEDRLLTRDGWHIAFLIDGAIIDTGGRRLGVLDGGLVRDLDGRVVAFTRDASGVGLTLPRLKLPPLPPRPQLAPSKPVAPKWPLQPAPSDSWSKSLSQEFFTVRPGPTTEFASGGNVAKRAPPV